MARRSDTVVCAVALLLCFAICRSARDDDEQMAISARAALGGKPRRLHLQDTSSMAGAADAPPAANQAASRTIYHQLEKELYNGISPYRALERKEWPFSTDFDYPHSNLQAGVVMKVLEHTNNPKFWLEIGSFIGNSAITTAKLVGDSTSVICMDPFTGDVNMWAWNKGKTGPKGKSGTEGFNFLEMDSDGTPRDYEKFLTNVRSSNLHDRILPVRVTSMAGMRLLPRLMREGRLDEMPKVIYLDSAHEKDETFMEVSTAVNTVQSGGILFGDDWAWAAVRGDVTRYAEEMNLAAVSPEVVSKFDLPGVPAQQPVDGVILAGKGQWLLLKP